MATFGVGGGQAAGLQQLTIALGQTQQQFTIPSGQYGIAILISTYDTGRVTLLYDTPASTSFLIKPGGVGEDSPEAFYGRYPNGVYADEGDIFVLNDTVGGTANGGQELFIFLYNKP